MSKNIDIETIQTQLNYLKETKLQLKQSLENKGQVIDDSKPFRDYTENIDKLGSVKMFNSIDEMNSDVSSDDKTIGLVYSHHLNEPTFDSNMAGGISLPRVIKLDISGYDLALQLFSQSVVTTNGTANTNDFKLVNDADESLNITGGFTKYTANGSLRDFYLYLTFKGSTYKYWFDVTKNSTDEVVYLATRDYPTDGGIYQLPGSNVGTYTFASTVDSNGNPLSSYICKLFYYGEIHFHNIYEFDKLQNGWQQAPHQFTAVAENVTTQAFFGKNGAEVGNLDAIKYVYDNTLYNLPNIHNLYSNLYKSVETSNVTCISNLGNYLGSKYIDYLQFNNLENCSNAFSNKNGLYGVEVGSWNMSKVHNASRMFYNLANWVALNISSWNVSNLKDASYMFYSLPKVESFQIQSWNTHNLVNARGMFSNNPKLVEVNWMNLNMINLQDASSMFAYCNSMYKANLCNNSYGWHKTANNVTTTANMFKSCTSLQQVLLCGTQGGWRCNNLTNTSGMFAYCKNLNTSFNSYSSYANELSMAFENVADASFMFDSCTSMYNLSLRNVWYQLENTASMFNHCTNLRDLGAAFWNQILFTNASHMFNNCQNLMNCRVFNNLNFPNLTNGANMFAYMKVINRLTQLYTEPTSMYTPNLVDGNNMFYMCNNARLLQWNMPNLTGVYRMYYGASGLSSLGMTNAYLPNITNFIGVDNSSFSYLQIIGGNFNKMAYFTITSSNNMTNIQVTNGVETPSLVTVQVRNLPNLTNLVLTGFNYAKMNTVTNFVNNCASLQSLNLAGANFHNVKALSSMITGCANLSTINMSGANFVNVTNMTQSFASLTNLTTMNLAGANFSNVTVLHNTFASTGLTKSPLDGMAFPNATLMINVFRDCKQLTSLNLAETEFPNLTSLSSIVTGCSNITDVNLINCNAPKLTSIAGMFKGCSNLVNLYIANNFTSNLTSLSCVFEGCTNLNFEHIDGLDTANVTDLGWVLTWMSYKDYFSVPNWNTSKVTSFIGSFYGAHDINVLDLTKWNSSNVTNMNEMFGSVVNINLINMCGMDTSNVKDIGKLFQLARDIKDINIDGCDFSNLTTISYMFNNVRNVDFMGKFFGGKTFNNVTSLDRLCSYSSGININLADAKFPNATGRLTLYNISGIKEINLDDIYAPNISSFTTMGTNLRFQNTIFTMRNFSPNSASSPFPLFNNSIGFMDVMDWSGWNLPNYTGPLVGNNIGTFATYSTYPNINIMDLNLSKFNGPNITYIDWSTVMTVPRVVNYAYANFANASYISFNGGRNMQTLDLTGLYAPNVTNIAKMFSYCNNMSSESIDNIINFFLTLNNIPAANKVLPNSNALSPFYNTNISSAKYSTRVAELQSAGWTV